MGPGVRSQGPPHVIECAFRAGAASGEVSSAGAQPTPRSTPKPPPCPPPPGSQGTFTCGPARTSPAWPVPCTRGWSSCHPTRGRCPVPRQVASVRRRRAGGGGGGREGPQTEVMISCCPSGAPDRGRPAGRGPPVLHGRRPDQRFRGVGDHGGGSLPGSRHVSTPPPRARLACVLATRRWVPPWELPRQHGPCPFPSI